MSSHRPSQPRHRAAAGSGVRNTFFGGGHLSPLSVPPGPPSTGAPSATRALRVDHGNGGSGAGGGGGGASDEDGIVPRDAQGNYQFQTRFPESVQRSGTREEPGTREAKGMGAEMHGNPQQPHAALTPEDIKASLYANLRAEVDSLEEDKWMFEGDASLSA